ncbi:LTA synthase family protein [Rhizobium sp. G187]|uniref:LTA synthase family protein n=1 Tax=unclassified Rhizobium TaxID=2613769 RepID=UPI0009EA530E|nr:LTA synthase family protein [Rhizobium sp. AAP43]
MAVFASEWFARGDTADILPYLTSTMRPGMIAVGVVALAILALDALLGRSLQSAVLVVPMAVLPAFFSGQKQQYLSDPLYPSDLLFGRQIFELLPAMVAAQPLLAVAVFSGAAVAISAVLYLIIRGRKIFPPLSAFGRVTRLVIALPILFGFASIMNPMTYSETRDRLNIIPMLWDQTENYRHNGFLLAFAINVPMAKVSAPDGYGNLAVSDIPTDRIPATFFSGRRADVIFLMSESLWDPTRLKNVGFSADPMPTIRGKQSGNVFSPEFGGMTANVEFEALTGFSNAFLPYGSIPYQQYIRRPVPSLATFFESKGYKTKAFHPFQSWFWNRKKVYDALGFQEFHSEETMPVMSKRGQFASDDALTRYIMDEAERTEGPFFFFGVTLQGHGPYEPGRYAKNAVTLDAPMMSPANASALATYTQGVKEADDSLKTLMDWAKKRQRETIIVVFGDHLPPLNEVYTQSGYMPNVVATRRASVETMKREHETPLVVWSSKRGVQKNLGTVSPALLPHYIVRLAGYRHPFYTGVLGRVSERYTVIDRHQLVGRGDKAQADWSLSGQVDPLIRDYRYLQHDMMFGEGYSMERFFPEQEGRLAPAS